MTRKVHEGFLRAYFLETLDDETLEEVTLAEISAGTRLTNLTADGVNEGSTFNRASIDLLDTGKVAEYVGTHGRSVNLQFARNTAEDESDGRDIFEYGTVGYLVVARDRFKADPQVGDLVTIYKISTFAPTPLQSAANSFQQHRVETAVENWSDPEAVVVAS